MRLLRFLLLFAAAAVAYFVAADYRDSRASRAEESIVAPGTIASELNSRSGKWRWSQQTADSAKLEIVADRFQQGADGASIELAGVELKILRLDGEQFDFVRAPSARFEIARNLFHSRADTEITLAVPISDPDPDDPALTRILTSDVVFNTQTGEASTDREALYRFNGGRGRSVGARYDSRNGWFEMREQAEIEQFASSPEGDSTLIRAGRLVYLEREQRVDLFGGASLDRGTRRIEAEQASVRLEDGSVRAINASNAAGIDRSAGRVARFRTPTLEAYYSSEQVLEKIVGVGVSELRSETASSRLHAVGDRAELNYKPDAEGRDGLLDEVHLRGSARVDVQPKTADGERRVVSSEWIHLRMREGGKDLAEMETLEPGRLELTPAGAPAPERVLLADRLRAEYAADNRMRSLAAGGAVRLRRDAAGDRPPLLTWSDALEADFDPETGAMSRLRQWANFRFEQGARKGQAGEGVYDPATGTLEMTAESRLDDGEIQVAAHRVELVEGSSALRAEGDVTTVYRAGKESGERSLFADDKPVYGAARRLESDQESGRVAYFGAARLWQGEDRVEAEEILIDRSARTLEASRNVVTFLKNGDDSAAAQPIEVRAAGMFYSDVNREARYRGDVTVHKGALTVRSAEFDARLSKPADGGAAVLESAEARGEVVIEQRASEGLRRGLSATADYDPGAEILILRGSPATAVNSRQETTRGARLTYRISDDKLLVSGGDDGKARTVRHRR